MIARHMRCEDKFAFCQSSCVYYALLCLCFLLQVIKSGYFG